MIFSRRILCDLGIKITLSIPFWMQARLARAMQQHTEALSSKPQPWQIDPHHLIVIDPGHGGKDPGCIGHGNIYEKDIVLATALDLNMMLRRAGYRTLMTREKDIFVPLQNRVDFAERHHATLLVSVHANAIIGHPDIRGASVYTFSPDPSDPLAAEIAQSENSVEILSTPNFKGVSKETSKILFDLMSRRTKIESIAAQRSMVSSLSERVDMLTNPARKATFAVLQSDAIPSILVETAFLSNAKDEAALRTRAFRMRLSLSMKQAVDTWFLARQNSPENIES
ncbi:N-acetylmuramoyl-L-alanine amidase family protein [Acidocella sp.]|uniref:N-acetylmuramoyl-L-alanine amidase family protein n=1 Tax=Acidocella sp. TaxID=50710 RepID=UPI003D0308AC